MKYCKNCKYYTKKLCKKKGFFVSINANFCDDYKEKFLYKIKGLINNK